MTDLTQRARDVAGRLKEGVQSEGLHDDNETELFDIADADEAMAEAAVIISELVERIEGLEIDLLKEID